MSTSICLTGSPDSVGALARTLESTPIPHCVWKGRARVAQALQGDGDLDVLVRPGDGESFAAALRSSGFSFFRNVRRDDPDLHAFGLSASAGRPVHVHVTWLPALTRSPRRYRPPWIELLLASRCFDDELRIWTAHPAVELVQLCVRCALDAPRPGVPAQYPDSRRTAELAWLQQRVNPADIAPAVRSMIGAGAVPVIDDIMRRGPRPELLRALRRTMRPVPADLATVGAARAAVDDLRTRLIRAELKVSNMLGRPGRTPLRRTPADGGLLIAVIGVDGSGKTSVTRELHARLRTALDVRLAYLGGGDQARSPARALMRALHSVRKWLRGAHTSVHAHPGQAIMYERAGSASLLKTLWFAAWALSLARVRRTYIRAAWRARDNGCVVISDRFPQMHITGYGDGPLLTPWLTDRAWLRRACAAYERRLFTAITARDPDIVVKLRADPEMVRMRRPTTHPDLLRRKAEAIEARTFSSDTRVLSIDADQPLETVVFCVLERIWEGL